MLSNILVKCHDLSTNNFGAAHDTQAIFYLVKGNNSVINESASETPGEQLCMTLPYILWSYVIDNTLGVTFY